jgi:hypothetical protein
MPQVSDRSQGPGWWQALDGKWYPPEQHRSPAGLIVGAVVAGLVILFAGIVIGRSVKGTTTSLAVSSTSVVPVSPSTLTRTNGTNVPTPTTRPTAATTVAAGPKVVYTLAGSGQGSTPTFGVANEWQVAWTYDCTAYGGQGNFIVDVSQPPGKVGIEVAANDQPVNQLGAGASGVQHYHYGGTVFLSGRLGVRLDAEGDRLSPGREEAPRPKPGRFM